MLEIIARRAALRMDESFIGDQMIERRSQWLGLFLYGRLRRELRTVSGFNERSREWVFIPVYAEFLRDLRALMIGNLNSRNCGNKLI